MKETTMNQEKSNYLEGLQPSIKSIHEHLTLHEVDCSFWGPEIHQAIKRISQMNMVTEETVLFVMLPIIATACGMNTLIDAGNRPIRTKSNIYVVNLLNSGGAKSQITNLLLKNTLKPLDKSLLEHNQRLQDLVVVDKQNGPIFNSTDRINELTRLRMLEHHALISKGTPESIFHFAGNGAMMLVYDELATFIDMFINGTRAITDLTELYQSHQVKKVLVGRSSASIDDSAVSLYAHGTPEFGRQLVTPKMKADGSCWRFWINIDTPEPLSCSFDEYKAAQSQSIPDFSAFDKLFKKIADAHFDRPTEWLYKFTPEALEAKSEIFDRLAWTANSLDESESTMQTLLLKLPAIIDKCALLHSIITTNLEDKSVFNAFDSKTVNLSSLDFGFAMAKKIWTGWMSLIQLEEGLQTDASLKETKIKKSTAMTLLYEGLLAVMGGPGIYDQSAFESALAALPYKNRMVKKRFLEFISVNKNLVVIQNSKVILSHVSFRN